MNERSRSNKMRLDVRALAAAVVAAHIGLAAASIQGNSTTVDEGSHLMAGLVYWRSGDFDLYRVNPPAARALVTLPLLCYDLRLPRSGSGTSAEALHRDFVRDNAASYGAVVRAARYVNLAFSVIVCGIVFCWAAALWGDVAGLTALTTWALNPMALAWSGVATPDMGAACLGVCTAWAMRCYVKTPTRLGALAVGITLGLALLTKFTLLILLLLWPLAFGLALLQSPSSRGWRLRSFVTGRGADVWIVPLIALVVVNAGYGFVGNLRPLGDFNLSSTLVRPPGGGPHDLAVPPRGNRFTGTVLARLPVPLPASFVHGVDEQKADVERPHWAYLRGEWKKGGWWHYYLYAAAVKLPLGFWGLVVLAAVAATRSRLSASDALLLWFTPIVLAIMLSCHTGLNAHTRYGLPILPFAAVGVSRVACAFAGRGRRMMGAATFGLLACMAVETVAVHPHYLSFFNIGAGGPKNGWKHLVDSNLDWGQDLYSLKHWLSEHPEIKNLRLAYCGALNPRVCDVTYTFPPPGPKADVASAPPPEGWPPELLGPRPGWYAVSVNFVAGMGFGAFDPAGNWVAVPRQRYTYFQRFEPVAMAGYSIYIYHITLDQANRVRRDLGLPALAAQHKGAKQRNG